jgi:predicted MPP superfamily phosphohydrolase
VGRRHALGLSRGRAAALAAVGAAAAGAAYAGIVEPRRLVVRRGDLRLPGWPAGLDGLRVALASDFHAGAPHAGPDRVAAVAARVRDERPDLALLLGDFIDPEVALAADVHPAAIAPALGAIGARLGTFAVLGNHDWMDAGEAVRSALERAGVPVLENDARPLAEAAAPLWLAGVADARERGADVAGTVARVPEDAAVLLLTHDPDVFPHVPPRVALTVAGHTHGGQVDVPLLRRRAIPSRYGTRYKAGHVEEGGRHLYVTAGVGTAGYPVRLFAPPEIVVLRLRSSPAG